MAFEWRTSKRSLYEEETLVTTRKTEVKISEMERKLQEFRMGNNN